MTATRRCVGAILAGGQGTRMGGIAKGLCTVGGRRMIDRAAVALRECCDDVMLVANDVAAAEWLPGVRVVCDAHPGLGALGGIHAALTSTGADIIVVAWDMPFVPAALLRALRDTGELEGADACAPSSGSPWGFEPLCAWFARGVLPAVDSLLDAGDGRAGAIAAHARLVTIDATPWGNPDELFFNVNTPAELATADARAERASGAREYGAGRAPETAPVKGPRVTRTRR